MQRFGRPTFVAQSTTIAHPRLLRHTVECAPCRGGEDRV